MARKKKLKWFTVLLSYPDYLTDSRNETFGHHALAEDVSDAVCKAQVKAAKVNVIDNPEDFAPIGTIRGRVTVYTGY